MNFSNSHHKLLVSVLSLFPLLAYAGLPDPGMSITPGRTALVLTDPQNDFLSPEGVTWGVVGASVTANDTVAHIGQLLESAKKNDIPVFVSPHYYFPTDDGWKFGGAVETMMHGINMFSRQGALSLEGFSGSGADWASGVAFGSSDSFAAAAAGALSAGVGAAGTTSAATGPVLAAVSRIGVGSGPSTGGDPTSGARD
jgi:hypothetical protein